MFYYFECLLYLAIFYYFVCNVEICAEELLFKTRPTNFIRLLVKAGKFNIQAGNRVALIT